MQAGDRHIQPEAANTVTAAHGEQLDLDLQRLLTCRAPTSLRSQEVRAILTCHCNFRCTFCHHEGSTGVCGSQTVGRWLQMLCDAVRGGVRDITLTGGEPTLVPSLVIGILQGLGETFGHYAPAMTIVTNGSRMSDDVIDALRAYPGPRKIHVSFHSANPLHYAEVTGGHRPGATIQAIRRLVLAGLRVKLNVVVQPGVNDNSADFDAILQAARDFNVYAVKFIPVLDVEGQAHVFTADTLGERLLALGHTVKITRCGRTQKFASVQFPGLVIEVTHCPCHGACSRCLETSGFTIGPDLRYYPCVRKPTWSSPIADARNLTATQREGWNLISSRGQLNPRTCNRQSRTGALTN